MTSPLSDQQRAWMYGWFPIILPLGLLLMAWLLRGQLVLVGSWIALGFGDTARTVIGLPVVRNFSGFRYMRLDWTPGPYDLGASNSMTSLFSDHVRLTAEGVALALLVALPVGIVLQRVRLLFIPIFGLLDAMYAIPSLAVFPALISIPWFGITDKTVLVALVAYAQFILVRNVVVGLDSVPAAVKESARGMGMNPMQILIRIELPLAMPVIAAGLRIATIASIGIAAIAAFVAIPDLGTLFYEAVQNGGVNSYPESLAGASAVIVLVLMADAVLRVVEYFIPANRIVRGERQFPHLIFRRLYARVWATNRIHSRRERVLKQAEALDQ